MGWTFIPSLLAPTKTLMMMTTTMMRALKGRRCKGEEKGEDEGSREREGGLRQLRIFQSRRSATVEKKKKKKRETSYAIPLQQRKSIRSRYPFVVLRRGGRQGATAAAANVTEGNFANSPKSRRRPLFLPVLILFFFFLLPVLCCCCCCCWGTQGTFQNNSFVLPGDSLLFDVRCDSSSRGIRKRAFSFIHSFLHSTDSCCPCPCRYTSQHFPLLRLKMRRDDHRHRRSSG